MTEVKIREKIENVIDPIPMGAQHNRQYRYPQLYFAESSGAVPDGIYTLKQGTREEMCSVTAGKVRGAEWVEQDQPIFLCC